MSVVEELENKFFKRCQSERARLAKKYPELKFSTWSSPIGLRTQYQGHDLGIECVFPLASPTQSDCVALIIGVMHLTTEPKLCQASVVWGAEESPDIEIDLIDDPVPYTDPALNEIEDKFHQLIDVFIKAIEHWGKVTGSFK